MSKDAVADWDTTAANNIDVGGISIAEGMAPANVNNAMREMMAQLATFNAAVTPNVVPPGAILMWSGSVASIPSGWALCNGTNGTPNLLDRFVVGAGQSYDSGTIGGANTVTLSESQIPAHTHSVTGSTNNEGAHAHAIGTVSATDTGPFNGVTRRAGRGGSFGEATTSAGTHTHSVTGTAASTGGGLAHENRPPYFALAFIMKL